MSNPNQPPQQPGQNYGPPQQQPYRQPPPQYGPQQFQPVPPTKKPKRFGWIAMAITAVVALGVGGVAGSGNTSTPTASPTVTATATATATKTVTEKAPAEIPQSCLDALDDADKAFSITSDAFNVVAKILDAASRFDAAGMNAETGKLKKLTKKVSPVLDRYRSESDDCRNS